MTPEPPPPFEPKPGEVIDGKYRCERVIGEGGMGAVVQATHLLRQAPVALKFMSGSAAAKPELVERFLNEAVAASRIDSDHVVKIFDVSRLADGTPYLVMEYLVGEELGVLLTREGKPGLESAARCVHFTLQILRALQIAHEAGIVHRDMKPANCFVVTRDGEPDFVKVIDFGISKMAQPTDSARLTRTHAMLGTPLYMAPEQVRSARRADLRTDLYAAGLILYELLSGRTPFHVDDNGIAGLFAEVLLGDPTPLDSLRPGLPEGLVAAVHRALTRDPAGRFASAIEMAEALAPFADERSGEVVRGIRRRGGSGTRASLPPPATAPEAPLPLTKPTSATGTVAEEPLLARRPSPATRPEPAEPVAGDPPDAATASPVQPPAAQRVRTAMGDSAAAVAATATEPPLVRRPLLPWLLGVALVGAAAATVIALSATADPSSSPSATELGAATEPTATHAAASSAASSRTPSPSAEDAAAARPSTDAIDASTVRSAPTRPTMATPPASIAPSTALPATTPAPTTSAPAAPTTTALKDLGLQP